MPAPAYSAQSDGLLYPTVGRSGHLALTHYREAEKYSVECAEQGRNHVLVKGGNARLGKELFV